MLETRAARIDQRDAAVTSGRRVFDKLTERFEYFQHPMAARRHFKHPLFTGEKRFGPFLVVVAPIDKLSVVLVALFGVAFLGERLSVLNWAGVLLIAAGAWLVAMR